jgi:hypothetical protein
MFVIAVASNFNGFLVGMAIGGLGFGTYVAVDLDLDLVVGVLPDKDNVAMSTPFGSRTTTRLG